MLAGGNRNTPAEEGLSGAAPPLDRGQSDLAADITMMTGDYESGEFLRKHAELVIQAQRQLAQGGYRVGGNAPYGFVRALVDALGTVLEELIPGRQLSQPRFHVRNFAKDDTKIAIWVMILELRGRGRGLTGLSVTSTTWRSRSPTRAPSVPISGVRHEVSGKWGPNTVQDLCENRPILRLVSLPK